MTTSCFERVLESPYWNIFLLALAWAMTLTTTTLLTSVAPLTAVDELGASGKLTIIILILIPMMMKITILLMIIMMSIR